MRTVLFSDNDLAGLLWVDTIYQKNSLGVSYLRVLTLLLIEHSENKLLRILKTTLDLECSSLAFNK